MNALAVRRLMRYQILSSLRSFASVFYTIALPLVIFVIFGMMFGVNADYAIFFLPGMIGVMTSSDALYAVGPVMKEYFRQGIVREFKGYPIHLVWLFITFILTRLTFVLCSAGLLTLMSGMIFGYRPPASAAWHYMLGVLLGFTIYSFIALSISFIGIRDNKDQGILSLYYFLGMFLSDAYFVLSGRNPVLDAIGFLFPLKVVLRFMRGNDAAILPCLAWLIGSGLILFVLVNKMKLNRR